MDLTLIGEPIGALLIVVLLADTLVHLWLIREERARRRAQGLTLNEADIRAVAAHALEMADAKIAAAHLDAEQGAVLGVIPGPGHGPPKTDDEAKIAAVKLYQMTPVGWKARGQHALDTVVGELSDPERLPAYAIELGYGTGRYLAHYVDARGDIVHEYEFNTPR